MALYGFGFIMVIKGSRAYLGVPFSCSFRMRKKLVLLNHLYLPIALREIAYVGLVPFCAFYIRP